MIKKHSIPVKKDYLNKNNCLAKARDLLEHGHIECMSEKQLAKEIFFHTLVYYSCSGKSRFNYLIEHADPIDLRDNGDTLLRKAAFNICWAIPEKIVRRKV